MRFEVGQKVIWHPAERGSEVCEILWVEPEDNLYALIEVPDRPMYSRFIVVPTTNLTARYRCFRQFVIGMNVTVRCDHLVHDHDKTLKHHAFIGPDGAELFWK